MGPQDHIYLPKHRQIIEALNGEIIQGGLKPYDRLPSEKDLCDQWQASRSTVRKAMDQLSDRGTIFRVPGKGSFVSFPKISHASSQVLSFTEKMKAHGLAVETKLISREVVDPGEEIAGFLNLAAREKILKIQRLRIVKGEPMALQTSFLPLRLCRELLGEDLESKSLNQLLREQCHIRLARSDVWIEAPVISRRERGLLGSPRLPLFLAVLGLTYDQQDVPVRFSRGVFRGDRVRMKISDAISFELDHSGLPG